MPLRKRHQDSAFVASAAAYDTNDYNAAQRLVLQRQQWQQRAWHFYDEVGEIHYAARYIANCISRIRLVAAIEQDDDAPLPTNEAAIQKAVRNIGSKRGGQRSFLRRTGLNLFVAGEMLMLGQGSGANQTWEPLSVNELLVVPGGQPQRIRFPGSPPEMLAPDTLIVRVWNEHPNYSGFADSALRPVLDDCEKLLLLNREEKASARSRFAGAGLLGIPIELVPPSWQNQGRTDDQTQTNPLTQQLTEAFMAPLRDESHPSAVVPTMLFGPAEYIDKIKHITFERAVNKASVVQREDAIKRIQAAIDLPPEVLSGMGDTNHWSATQIHEESFQAHIQPFIELIVDGLTEGYLRPALKRAGVPNFEQYVIWYDETALLKKPNTGEAAVQAHDRLALSDEGLRSALGLDEEDRIKDPEEYNKRVGVKLVDLHTAITGNVPDKPPSPVDVVEAQAKATADAQVKIQQATPPASADLGGRPKGPGGGAAPPKQASERRDTGSVSRGPKPGSASAPAAKPVTASAAPNLGMSLGHIDQAVMQTLRLQGDAALRRSMERAGARLRSRISGEKDIKASVAGVPNHLVASTLGPAVVASLGINDDDFIVDEFKDAEAKAYAWLRSGYEEAIEYIRAFLHDRGIAEAKSTKLDMSKYLPGLDENLERAKTTYHDALLTEARKGIYDPSKPPTQLGEGDDLAVPPSVARSVLIQAGGGPVSPAEAPLSGGVATGRTIQDILNDHEVKTRGHLWIYGVARQRPFNSHLQLDGARFENSTDEILRVWPEDAWLRRSHYQIQDHKGCMCIVAPYVDIYGS